MRITWKFFIYLAVTALSALPAALTSSLLGYGPPLLLLSCGVLSLVWLRLVCRRLDFDVQTDTLSCVRGGEAEFQVRIKNNGRLPTAGVRIVFFLSGSEGLDEQVNDLWLTLSPREERAFSFSAACLHIGSCRAGIRRIELTDAFGIFKAVYNEEKSYTVEVLPRVVPLSSLPVTANVQSESRRMSVQSPLTGSDYTGVREYAIGDPIKNIHWKLSAHSDGLMTKQMESYSNTGLSVVLDLEIPARDGAARLDEFDAVVEAGAAAGNYAAEQGMDYDLLFRRADGETARLVPASFRSLNGIIDEMHIQEPNGKNGVMDILKNSQGTYGQANIVVCSCVLSLELAEMLVKLKQGGRTPIFFLVLPKLCGDRERQERTAQLRRLQYANIACRIISSADELEAL
ncbi:MAG: DUF58 domain-containing protein [Oscillospiraceae bacterium]|nr:DUF58 domain-containing protein [Oscillospiraceae bacterium]